MNKPRFTISRIVPPLPSSRGEDLTAVLADHRKGTATPLSLAELDFLSRESNRAVSLIKQDQETEERHAKSAKTYNPKGVSVTIDGTVITEFKDATFRQPAKMPSFATDAFIRSMLWMVGKQPPKPALITPQPVAKVNGFAPGDVVRIRATGQPGYANWDGQEFRIEKIDNELEQDTGRITVLGRRVRDSMTGMVYLDEIEHVDAVKAREHASISYADCPCGNCDAVRKFGKAGV